MNQVLSTAELAASTGIPEGTLRSYKSRNSNLLIEGVHWVMDGKKTLWTELGKTVVLQLSNGVEQELASTDDLEQRIATVAAPYVQHALLNVADRMFMQQLKQIILSPTPEQSEALANHLERRAMQVRAVGIVAIARECFCEFSNNLDRVLEEAR